MASLAVIRRVRSYVEELHGLIEIPQPQQLTDGCDLPVSRATLT
jgi:hypothetical protein